MTELAELKPEEIQYQIASDEDLNRLTLVLRRVQESLNKIDEKLDPEIANAFKTHKSLNALKKETRSPWEEVKTKINASIKGWHVKKEAEAKALQDKINKELADKAEALRLEKLEEAEASNNEWVAEIKKEEAKAIVSDSVDLSACQQAILPKETGQYKRSNWKCRIIDESKLPREFLIPDLRKLDDFAKKFKCDGLILGCEMWDDFMIVTKL